MDSAMAQVIVWALPWELVPALIGISWGSSGASLVRAFWDGRLALSDGCSLVSGAVTILLLLKNSDVLGISGFEKEKSLGGSCDTESSLDWVNVGLVSSLLLVIKEGLMAEPFRPARHCQVERVSVSWGAYLHVLKLSEVTWVL
jgi:hypothetical protein